MKVVFCNVHYILGKLFGVSLDMDHSDFRKFLPTPETSKINGETARQHAKKALNRPRIIEILDGWGEMYAAPYYGMTVDGEIVLEVGHSVEGAVCESS